jgi:hypothetical protein
MFPEVWPLRRLWAAGAVARAADLPAEVDLVVADLPAEVDRVAVDLRAAWRADRLRGRRHG